jgi:membrane protease YdiL (CAAX protease family)
MIFNAIHMIVPMILSFYALIAFRHHFQNNQLAIPHSKNFLHAFFLAFGLYLLILNGFTAFGVWEKANTINDYRLIQLPIILTISSCTLFKVRLRDFNWSINAKTLLFIFVLFILLKLSYIVATDLDSLKGLPVDYFFRNFIQQIYYPSIVEEVIFRGFLLSGLLAIGFRESNANLIQAIVFGLIHTLPPNELTIISILATSMQMYLGYLIGKVYLSTKSLTPGILLHALIDTI